MPNIICVKIAQRMIPSNEKLTPKHHFDYFPFDRGYLIPPESTAYIPRLFRAYMIMDFTEELRAALNDLSFTRVYHDTVHRNFNAPQPGKARDVLDGLCDNPADWKLVIPTFLRNKYSVKSQTYVHAAIGYILSHAVGINHNVKASLPRISFVTPPRTYPLMCVACLQLPEQLAGKCTIGTAKCRRTRAFELPVDPLQTKIPEEATHHDRIQ